MKLQLMALFFLGLFLVGCVNMGPAKLEVKQVIPIGPGTIIEASAPLSINLSQLPISEKAGMNNLIENSNFAIPVIIHSPKDKSITNVSLKISYNPNYFDSIKPYFLDGSPLPQVTNNTFQIDDKMNPSTDTTVFLIGHAKEIPGLHYAGVDYAIDLLYDSSQGDTRFTDLIQINRKT